MNIQLKYAEIRGDVLHIDSIRSVEVIEQNEWFFFKKFTVLITFQWGDGHCFECQSEIEAYKLKAEIKALLLP